MNGIFWQFRAGAPWASIPERYESYTTCYNHFARWWCKAGMTDRLLTAISAAYDGDIVMIDDSFVHVHQHGTSGKKEEQTMLAWAIPMVD